MIHDVKQNFHFISGYTKTQASYDIQNSRKMLFTNRSAMNKINTFKIHI